MAEKDETITVEGLQFFVTSKAEGGAWVAGCPQIDVYSQGETKEAALRSLDEAVKLWAESCVERGTLAEAVKELGFTKKNPPTAPVSPEPPVRAPDDVAARIARCEAQEEAEREAEAMADRNRAVSTSASGNRSRPA